MKTKYITLDDFKQYFVDVDLRSALGSEESALAFLKRIEDRMESFINSNFCRNISLEYACFTDFQKEHYKLALLEQAIYIFRNSDISVDSGYDPERGVIVDRSKIKELSISPNTIEHLRMCGLWNRNVRSNRFAPIWWIR